MTTAGATGSVRVKTKWTGNLSVPAIEEPTGHGRSKLPLVIGLGVVLAGVAALALFLANRGGGEGTGSGSGSVGAVVTNPPPPPPVTIDAAVTIEPPPLAFEWSVIKLDSVPQGAEVKDLSTDKVIGKTPFGFKVKPSRTPRQFQLHLKGYTDHAVELVPDKDKIEISEKLEKGALTPIPHPAAVDAGVTPIKPDAPVQVTVPDDDCGDPPCLKADPSRRDAGVP